MRRSKLLIVLVACAAVVLLLLFPAGGLILLAVVLVAVSRRGLRGRALAVAFASFLALALIWFTIIMSITYMGECSFEEVQCSGFREWVSNSDWVFFGGFGLAAVIAVCVGFLMSGRGQSGNAGQPREGRAAAAHAAEMACSLLERGHTKLALDQAFAALRLAPDDPTVLAELGAIAARAQALDGRERDRLRVDELADQVRQHQQALARSLP